MSVKSTASRNQLLISAGVLYVLSILRTGYAVYLDNQSIHLPLVHLLIDPSLYAGDPFCLTLKYYASPLWHVVARLGGYFSLSGIFFTLFLAERALVIGSAGYLAHTFFPTSRLSAISAMALFALTIQPVLGAGTLILPYFEHTGLAVAVFLLAAATFYKGQKISFILCMALILNLNLMYGVYAFTYFLAILLADPVLRRQWKKWAVLVPVFLVLAAPALWMAVLALNRPPSNNYEWVSALQFFFPDHFYPEMWRKLRWVTFGALFSMITVFFYILRSKHPRIFCWNMACLAVSSAWLFFSILSAYAAPLPVFLMIHPARATDLWYCLGGISLVAAAAERLQNTGPIRKRWFFAALLCAGLLLWIPQFPEPFQSAYRRFQFKETFVQTASPEVLAIGAWAKGHTAKDAQFAVDPSWDAFRAVSDRGVYCLWYDGAAILWDRTFAGEWLERLRGLRFSTERVKPLRKFAETRSELSRLFDLMNDPDMSRLKIKYPALRYWVAKEDKSSQFPEVYRSQGYKVLEVK